VSLCSSGHGPRTATGSNGRLHAATFPLWVTPAQIVTPPHVILFLKNLLFILLVPGLIAGWVPFYWFERRAQWPEIWRWSHSLSAFGFALGALIYLYCVWLFATKGRGTPAPIAPTKHLVQRGLYAWVRNPMSWAIFLLVGSEALFFRSIDLTIYFVCLVCVVHLYIALYEESALGYKFGAMYEDYKRAVPRWLPRKPRPALETIAPFATRR